MNNAILNLFYLLFFMIIILILSLNSVEKFDLKIVNNLNVHFKNISNISNKNECDWFYFNEGLFFKKQSSFFFLDVSLLLINFISKNSYSFQSFDLLLNMNNNKTNKTLKKKIDIKNVKIELVIKDFYQIYAFYNLFAKFNLQKYIKINKWELKDVDLKVVIIKKQNSKF